MHRDLKPENLWVTGESRIKILDFGLAKLSEPAKHSGAAAATTVSPTIEHGRVMGTVGYMSPEQVRGQPLDHRTDIFSFGTILHEMLSGSRAFHGPSSVDTQFAILNAEPPELAGPAVNRLVRRCLEKDPEQRFQSANDLIVDLEAALDAQPDAGEAERSWFCCDGAASYKQALARPQLRGWRRSGRGCPAGGVTGFGVPSAPAHHQAGSAAAGELVWRRPSRSYFADGMTDLLITDLGQIGALRVISRPSVMQFKGTERRYGKSPSSWESKR